MKIAVAGIGVAGAYLMNKLSQDRDNTVKGFERMPESKHDAVCAWATCDNVMGGLVKECGLDFSKYVLHKGKNMKVELINDSIDIKLSGMVAYDKLQLIKDMIRGTDIEFGKVPRKENLESDFDLIVDATGFHRNYLRKVSNETWIPCVQYKVKYDRNRNPYDDFYLKAFSNMSGYFWYFPLDNGYAHVGAGDFGRKYTIGFLDEFLSRHECEIIHKVGRPVRISPPSLCEPFSDGRKTIGVGESIGTVYALLGEGIVPSTWCAQLFVEHLNDLNKYRDAVLKKFDIYSLVHKFIKMKISGRFSLLRNSRDLLRIYTHMKMNEKRYGMKVRMKNMLKISRI
jgi:flavin-dependent dehydrogenase